MRKFLAIMILVCMFSCQKNKNHDYHFSDSAFVNVLADFYIAEQIIRNNGADKDSISDVLKKQVFQLHGIADTTLFNEELRMLMADTKKYKMIGDSVVKKLENLEIEVRKNRQ